MTTCSGSLRDKYFFVHFHRVVDEKLLVHLAFILRLKDCKARFLSDTDESGANAFTADAVALVEWRKFHLKIFCNNSWRWKKCEQLLNQGFWRFFVHIHNDICLVSNNKTNFAGRWKHFYLYLLIGRDVLGKTVFTSEIIINVSNNVFNVTSFLSIINFSGRQSLTWIALFKFLILFKLANTLGFV